MRFTINREYFLKALTTASKAVLSKSAIPIYKNLKLSIDELGLSVLGSNDNVSILTTIPFKDGETDIIRSYVEGDILVDSKIFTELIRKMEGNDVVIDVVDETVIQIDDGKSSFSLNSIRAEEYPDIDFDKKEISFVVECAAFTEIVEQTAFAASTKEQQQNNILLALNLDIENGLLVATATDSARLAKKTIELDSTDHISVNISARILSEIVRLFEGEKTVEISLDERKAVFKFGNISISSNLIAQDYPNTKNLVPKTFNYYLRANSNELINAMERAALLSGERENVVKLSMSEESVEIGAKSAQTGWAKEELEAFEFSGEKLDISFNSLFVVAAIKALKCEEVTMAFIGEMKPFVIKNDRDDSIIQLVTPVRTY